MAVCFAFNTEASSPQYIALADSADNLIKKERWAEAEMTLLSALRLEPGNFTNALLLSNLGVARTNLGKTNEALEAFGLGLSIAPRSSIIRNNRARTYLLTGDYKSAITDLDNSLEIDSLQEWPLQMRGLLLLGNNNIEGAKKDFNAALKINPRNPSALTGLARAAEIEGNATEALRLYNQALDIDDNPETRFSRILLKINTGKYSEASEDINSAITRYPEVADFYLARGYLHHLNYRNEEAKMDKKIAIDKGADPQFVEHFIPENGR